VSPLPGTHRNRRRRCRPDAAASRGRRVPARQASHRRGLRGLSMADTPHLSKELFGTLPDGRAVERVVLRGAEGFEARIITFGAALQALITPDARGACDDVVLGYDDLAGYLAERRFFGATVGRYANRIANARFVLDGTEVQLAANNGANALHGGLDGFDRKLWQITDMQDGAEPQVTLAHTSADREEGYPGRLDVH